MPKTEAMEFFTLVDNIKLELDAQENLNPTSHSKVNSRVETQHKNGEEVVDVKPSVFPQHVNHYLTIQNNMKEEPGDMEEDLEDPLGGLEPDVTMKYRSKISNLKTESTETHTDEKRYKCESCERSFRCSSNLIKHKLCHRTGVKVKQHECETCGKCFPLTLMLKSDRDTKCDVCGICEIEFGPVNHVKVNRVCQTGVEPHKCKACERSFCRSDSLKKHIGYHHTKDKLYKCGECGKQFPSTGALNKHMDGHTRPYKCNVCEKSFASQYLLNSHIDYHHTTDTSYKCDVCQKEFPGLMAVKAHQRLHTRLSLLECNLCEKMFRNPSHLNRHMMCHAKYKSYMRCVYKKRFTT